MIELFVYDVSPVSTDVLLSWPKSLSLQAKPIKFSIVRAGGVRSFVSEPNETSGTGSTGLAYGRLYK
jgi:hypothetical protein